MYNKIAWTDPEIHELVRSIKEHGIQEPLLISTDGFIISGHRRRQAALLAELDHPYYDGLRCKISIAKKPLLDAINRVLEEQREYWPLSDRQVHYRLLGSNAPLIHAFVTICLI